MYALRSSVLFWENIKDRANVLFIMTCDLYHNNAENSFYTVVIKLSAI